MKYLFVFPESPHYIRNFLLISNENEKKLNDELETLSYRTPVLLAICQLNIIHASSLGEFKQKIKDRECETWVCLLYHSHKKRKDSLETQMVSANAKFLHEDDLNAVITIIG